VFTVTQGGFRPSTSYSGSTHNRDAVDLASPITAAVVQALRSVGIAAWDRTGMGNWMPHIHGVPLPGAGDPSPSAAAQAADYLRGGNGLGGPDNGIGSGNRPSSGASVADIIRGAVAGWLDRVNEAGSSPFAKLAAAMPRILVDGMIQNAKGVLGFDAGGWLEPGSTVAVNRTGKPEAVLTGDQWDRLLDSLERLVVDLDRRDPIPAVISARDFEMAAGRVYDRKVRQ